MMTDRSFFKFCRKIDELVALGRKITTAFIYSAVEPLPVFNGSIAPNGWDPVER
jgi:F0F1-type ATP synthase beta subunit